MITTYKSYIDISRNITSLVDCSVLFVNICKYDT